MSAELDTYPTHSVEYVELTTRVAIDKGIVELIKAIWRLGYITHFCCQGDRVLPGDPGGMDRAYISLFDDRSAEKLASALGLECDIYVELKPSDTGPAPLSQWISGRPWIERVEFANRSVLRFPAAMLPDLTEKAQSLAAEVRW